MRRRAAALLVALSACSPPPAPQPRPAPPPPRPAAPPPPADLGGAVAQHRSERFDIRFPLPDAAGWRVDDAKEPWLVATHAAAEASLLVRTWREDGRASREACEARARLWRDLPARERATIVEKRRIDVPAGFDTVVEIGVLDAGPGNPMEGFAMAFGGWARRCFAWVATTRAAGPGAERLVGARLAAMVEVSLSGLVAESELGPGVRREPVP